MTTTAIPSAPRAFVIVTPVYNDWAAFAQLMIELEKVFPTAAYRIEVIAVDDCSIGAPAPIALNGAIARIEQLRLTMNVGHQRAIAVGLVQADRERRGIATVVMDADGEDTPAELKRLIDLGDTAADRAIVAQRRRRSEGIGFKLFYWCYRRVFRLLTGHVIDFGNFSVLPAAHVERLVHNAHIWNNLAATVIQAKLPILRVPTTRGTRYAGKSKMNLVSLVTHGLGAISVFSDVVFVRILLFSMAVLGGAALLALAVLILRLTTTLAVPGWTTSVMGFMLLLGVQAVMLPILVAFLQLGSRSSFVPGPREHTAVLIEHRSILYQRDDGPVALHQFTMSDQRPVDM